MAIKPFLDGIAPFKYRSNRRSEDWIPTLCIYFAQTQINLIRKNHLNVTRIRNIAKIVKIILYFGSTSEILLTETEDLVERGIFAVCGEI